MQKKLLVALAKESTREFDDAYRSRHGVGTSSTVNSAKRKLLEDGHIEQFATGCRLADPFFAEFKDELKPFYAEEALAQIDEKA